MGKLLVYWITGCLVVGVGYGIHKNKCPNDKLKNEDAWTFTAMWPLALGYAMAANHVAEDVCKTTTP